MVIHCNYNEWMAFDLLLLSNLIEAGKLVLSGKCLYFMALHRSDLICSCNFSCVTQVVFLEWGAGWGKQCDAWPARSYPLIIKTRVITQQINIKISDKRLNTREMRETKCRKMFNWLNRESQKFEQVSSVKCFSELCFSLEAKYAFCGLHTTSWNITHH